MNDYICVALNKGTGLYHALLYMNKPTPSECDRPWLIRSVNEGCVFADDAVAKLLVGLDAEYIASLSIY